MAVTEMCGKRYWFLLLWPFSSVLFRLTSRFIVVKHKEFEDSEDLNVK